MKKSSKFSPEVRERAVRMVQEQRGAAKRDTHKLMFTYAVVCITVFLLFNTM